MQSKWSASGSYFESCTCNVACPCVFTSDPTFGDCTVLIAWHIEKGKYGDVNLADLNVALVSHTPGNMLKTKWEVGLYIDEKGNVAQREALSKIFGGQAGGEPAALGPLVGKILGVSPVPISYHAQGKERTMRIPSIASMEIAAIEGQQGNLVTLENPPLVGVPGQTIVVGKSRKFSFHDHGMNLEVSDKNGFYAPFAFKGP